MRVKEVGYLARHAPVVDGIRHAERRSRRLGRMAGEDLAMTAIQAHYAQYLAWSRYGMPMSMLAAHTRTSAANVSQMVQRMEAADLVRRERSLRDGRIVLVRITARGRWQFWRLFERLRQVDAELRARAAAGRRDAPATLVKRIAGPPPALLADPPPKIRVPDRACRGPGP